MPEIAGDPAFVPNAAAKPDRRLLHVLGGVRWRLPGRGEPRVPRRVRALRAGGVWHRNAGLLQPRQRAELLGGTHPELWPSTGAIPCQKIGHVRRHRDSKHRLRHGNQIRRGRRRRCSDRSSAQAGSSTRIRTPMRTRAGVPGAPTSRKCERRPPRPEGRFSMRSTSTTTRTDGNTPPGPAQCVQSPRLFWDPSYRPFRPQRRRAWTRLDPGVADYSRRPGIREVQFPDSWPR